MNMLPTSATLSTGFARNVRPLLLKVSFYYSSTSSSLYNIEEEMNTSNLFLAAPLYELTSQNHLIALTPPTSL